MKKIRTFRSSLFIVLAFGVLSTFLLSACGVMAPQSVKALGANTATVAANAPLPIPAETLSASPAASRIEFSVQNASLEVKVIDVARPHIVDLGISANLGTELIYTPGDGNMFLELGIKVSNLTGSDIPLKWTDIYLVNKYQEKWYPAWGAYEKSNKLMDPLTVQILEFDQVDPEFDPDAHLYVAKNGYLRVIFRVPEDNLYYFLGITDTPLIEINWRYYQ